MNSSVSSLALPALLIAIASCSGNDAHDDATSPSDAPPSEAPLPDGSPHFSVRGAATDLDGRPWANAQIGVCSTAACYYGSANADGMFVRRAVPPGDYVVDVRAPATDLRRTSAVLFPLTVRGDVVLDAAVHIPALGGAIALAEAGVHRVSLGDNLTVTVDVAWLAVPSTTHDAKNVIASVRVPPAAWPPYRVSGARLVGLWALAPFGTTASSPIAVEIQNVFALPAGSAASLLTLDTTTGALVEAAVARVSDDGAQIRSSGGAGITVLTWLALAVPL